MYFVSFDVGRFQRKKDGSKRRTKAYAREYIRRNRRMGRRSYPLGSATYDLLQVDFYNQASVDAFARKWRIIDFPLRSGSKIPSGKVVSEGASEVLEFEQFRIEFAVRALLLVDERSAHTTYSPLSSRDDGNNSRRVWDLPNFDGLSTSERFTYYGAREATSAKIRMMPVYRMSERTWGRQQAKLRPLGEELVKLYAGITEFERKMGEEKPIQVIAGLIEEYPLEDLEVVFPKDYEMYHRMKKEYNSKIEEYSRENAKGWEVAVEYEVPDVISICWLELFTSIQHGIPARLCSLCQRCFIVTGRANMRQCPECRKNPAKAWRKANESVLNEDGSSEG